MFPVALTAFDSAMLSSSDPHMLVMLKIEVFSLASKPQWNKHQNNVSKRAMGGHRRVNIGSIKQKETHVVDVGK